MNNDAGIDTANSTANDTGGVGDVLTPKIVGGANAQGRCVLCVSLSGTGGLGHSMHHTRCLLAATSSLFLCHTSLPGPAKHGPLLTARASSI